MPLLPDVQFGGSDEPLDWREMPDDDTPDDDAELAETPEEVVGMLGFDPLDDDGEVEKVLKSNPNHDELGRCESEGDG